MVKRKEIEQNITESFETLRAEISEKENDIK
jgi:hypothetical protein